MLTKPIVLAVIVALLAGAPPAAAARPEKEQEKAGKGDAGRTRIQGRVLRADGKTAVPGAVVKIVPLQAGTETTTVACDAKGRFRAESVPIGYVDFVVESEGAAFIGNQVVNVPPLGSLEADLVVALRTERTTSWWSGREIRTLPGGGTADGLAEVRTKAGGKDFWRSPKGLAILGGIGAVALLAIASGGGSDASPTQP